jgi:hypothetical protein
MTLDGGTPITEGGAFPRLRMFLNCSIGGWAGFVNQLCGMALRNQADKPTYVLRRRSREGVAIQATSYFWEWKISMLKNLSIVFGLVAGLSACAAPYGYGGYGNAGYGYNEPAYYGPVYYGPGYYPPHTSQHGTVQ